MNLTKLDPQAFLNSLPEAGKGRTKAILHFLSDRYNYKYLTTKNYVRIGVFGDYDTMDDLVLDLDNVDERIKAHKAKPRGLKAGSKRSPKPVTHIPAPRLEIPETPVEAGPSLKDRLMEMREKRAAAIAESQQILQMHASNLEQLSGDLAKIDAVIALLEKEERS